MGRLVDYLDRKFYPGTLDNWDDTLFRAKILEFIGGNSTILDLGAGAGIVESMNFRGVAGKVCGIDLDERVVDNPFLDEAIVTSGEQIPFSDSYFDVVFSDNVLEHLEEPETVFREVFRVLKPGGVFVFKTPNRTHYMPLIARLTPHRFHQFVNRLRGREEVDTFPTLYRANSKRQITRLCSATGFTLSELARVEGRPEYLRISAPTYLLGVGYERFVNSANMFAMLRILLLGVLQKPHQA